MDGAWRSRMKMMSNRDPGLYTSLQNHLKVEWCLLPSYGFTWRAGEGDAYTGVGMEKRDVTIFALEVGRLISDFIEIFTKVVVTLTMFQ
jgi:hypothetical protein